MFELDVTAMSGNKSRMSFFGPGMQSGRAEEGAFFSGGPEIQWGANGHTYFASVRTRYDCFDWSGLVFGSLFGLV